MADIRPSSPTATGITTAKSEKHGLNDGADVERVLTQTSIDKGAVPINASGHTQELDRNFSLLSICAIAITTGNSWIAMGGSIKTAIYNGGPMGVLYEFMVVSVMYWLVGSSIAELASAIPSSAGVYHWASVTAGPRFGRVVGFFAGYWNTLAWIFGAASMSAILGSQLISMYSLFHPALVVEAWQVFVAYILATWLCCATVLFGNRVLPLIGNVGGFLIIAGVVITVIVVAVMPSTTGSGYATDDFVWRDWINDTGYSSNGLCFVLGMLNGAYSVGTPDLSTHLAEEIPHPSRNVPIAIAAQLGTGFVTGLFYMIPLMYSINDIDAVFNSVSSFPLADLYHQATSSRGGALGLLILAFLPTLVTCIGCYTTAGRCVWTLARDDAAPFSRALGHISRRFENPFAATLVCGAVVTVLGAIYVGSTTAFNAFVGSFVQLSSLSYLAAILPHLLSGRSRIRPGVYWMRGVVGWLVNAVSCLYLAAFVVLFCFPYAMPVVVDSMNYTSVITGGLTVFVAVWWMVKGRTYEGPRNVGVGGGEVVGVDVEGGAVKM